MFRLRLPPRAVKNRDAPQRHSFCPSTGGTCSRARLKRPCWSTVREGVATFRSGDRSGLSHADKLWNFKCKFLLSGPLSSSNQELSSSWDGRPWPQ